MAETRTERELNALAQCVEAFERVPSEDHNRMLMYLLVRFGGWRVPVFANLTVEPESVVDQPSIRAALDILQERDYLGDFEGDELDVIADETTRTLNRRVPSPEIFDTP